MGSLMNFKLGEMFLVEFRTANSTWDWMKAKILRKFTTKVETLKIGWKVIFWVYYLCRELLDMGAQLSLGKILVWK